MYVSGKSQANSTVETELARPDSETRSVMVINALQPLLPLESVTWNRNQIDVAAHTARAIANLSADASLECKNDILQHGWAKLLLSWANSATDTYVALRDIAHPASRAHPDTLEAWQRLLIASLAALANLATQSCFFLSF